MKEMLESSAITKEEKQRNPEAVYQALRYMQNPPTYTDKYMTQHEGLNGNPHFLYLHYYYK